MVFPVLTHCFKTSVQWVYFIPSCNRDEIQHCAQNHSVWKTPRYSSPTLSGHHPVNQSRAVKQHPGLSLDTSRDGVTSPPPWAAFPTPDQPFCEEIPPDVLTHSCSDSQVVPPNTKPRCNTQGSVPTPPCNARSLTRLYIHTDGMYL